MNREIRKAESGLNGQIEAHGDKSITHRAFMFNSIANGVARIQNASPSTDCQSTVSCLQQAGARIEREGGGNYIVRGVGRYGLVEPSDVLYAGNSGTTARILPSILAAQNFTSFITGDVSLRQRPMDRIIKPLALMGARITGREHNRLLPISITGANLSGIDITIPVASAQVKTAILLAGLMAGDKTTVTEPSLSRDHTERMLSAAGAAIARDENSASIEPGEINAIDINVPGDISSVAFFIVAASCLANSEILIKNVGLNPTRTGILEILKDMNAKVTIENFSDNFEPVGDILVSSAELSPFSADRKIVPKVIDELPILAVAATQAKGQSEIRDAEELRVKESDRINAMALELSKMGAVLEELPDGLIIKGPTQLKGARVDSHGDHRVAMSLAVAALMAEGETVIENFDCVSISYPDFYEDLMSLVGG